MQSRYYNPTIGRFINADAFASTGQGVLGNNMFAYCGNSPIGRSDPSGNAFVHIGFGFDTMDLLCPALGGSSGGGCAYGLSAASHVAKVLRKDDSKQNGTTSRGITISGAFSIAVAVTFGYTYDENGNSGLYLTVSGGGGTPTAGISISEAKTNAPTIYDQRGLGLTMGASANLGPTPVSVGGEYNMLMDSSLNYAYSGITKNVGAGVGLPAEYHGTIDYTWVWGKKEIWCWLLNQVYTGR